MTTAGMLIVSALRVALDVDEPACFADSIPAAPDWESVFAGALEHGVAALVCDVLLRHAANRLPDELRQACQVFLDSRESAGTRASAQLLAIFDDLAAHDIPAIPIKGPCLAVEAYGDLRLRGFRDLDFLIRASDVAAVEHRLIARGYATRCATLERRKKALYRRINRQDIFFAPDLLPVEPHWDFGPSTLGLRLCMDEVWKRARHRTLFGRELLMLSAEDTLLSLALHGYKERWTKLLWIADIAWFVRSHADLDWDRLTETARAGGMTRMLTLALQLAQHLLGLQLPAPVGASLHPERETKRIAAQIAASLFAPRAKEDSVYHLSLYGWHMRDGLADRMRYLLRSCFATELRHIQAVNLPDRLAFAYPAVALLYDTLAKPAWKLTKSVRRRSLPEPRGDV